MDKKKSPEAPKKELTLDDLTGVRGGATTRLFGKRSRSEGKNARYECEK